MMKKVFAAFFVSFALCSLGACKFGMPEKSNNVALESANNLAAADNFIAQNKIQQGVVTTPSGLQYKIISAGDEKGASPKMGTFVRVNYEGKLLNNEVFDSSYKRGQAAEFSVGDLIPAWNEMLQLMHQGEEVIIWVHPKIGYGEASLPYGCGGDNPCKIPANSLLVFKMKLESIIGENDAPIDIPKSAEDNK